MGQAARDAAAFWLRLGYFPPGLSSALVERLDAWAMRVEMAGPTALTALRAETGLPELSEPADDLAALEDEELDPEAQQHPRPPAHA